METELQLKHKVSTHLRELLKSDVNHVEDICNWLQKNAVKQRDIDRRTVSKRHLARMIAAQIALKAARDGDIQAAREVMDRTEGKVADKLITVDYNDLVRQLEAARARVLNRGEQHPQRVLESHSDDRRHMSHYQTSESLTLGAGDGDSEPVLSDVTEDALPVRPTVGTLTGPIMGGVDTSHPISTRDKEKESTCSGSTGEVVDTPTTVVECTSVEPGNDVLEIE